MSTLEVTHVIWTLIFFFYLSVSLSEAYEAPLENIEVLQPKGFRVSIPDIPGLALFAFHGNVNRPLPRSRVGTISGEVVQPTAGRWVFEEPNVHLKVGDVINYYFYVAINRKGYLYSNLNYTVKAPKETATTWKPIRQNPEVLECRPTLTKVVDGIACAGQIIFEDDFNSLREDLWRIEQFIPINHPEYPFVSYQKHTVSVSNGFLHITPRLQTQLPGFKNDTIYNGILNLRDGCTSEEKSCYLHAFGAEILPPVVSGRLTSQGFAFTYGTIFVRARMPQGDWLYPEILLQPLYGLNNGGLLKIASARGNTVLYAPAGVNYGNKVLYGGAVLDSKCRESLLASSLFLSLVGEDSTWSEDFHVYSMTWAPDRITLAVDGKEWVRVEPAEEGLWSNLPAACRNGSAPPTQNRKSPSIAPFDKPYYITLGVAAGGTAEFKDGISTEGGLKPWSNREHEAGVNFWRAVDSWYPTWRHPELIIDYIRVITL